MMKNSFESNAPLKILHWISVYFPDSAVPVVQECAQLCPTLCDPVDCTLSGSSVYGILQARVLDSCSLLQGIFLTQGSNPCLLHCGFFTCWAAYSYYMRFNCVPSEKMQETINSVYLHVVCVSYHKSLHCSACTYL